MSIPLSPFSFVKCDMEGLGCTSSGFGDGFFLKGATLRAFSESWERLWMLAASSGKKDIGIQVTSSNGFAAGRTEGNALLASRDELIERALLLKAWEDQRGWFSYRLKHVIAGLLSSYLERRGWQIRFFLVRCRQLGMVIVGFAEHRRFGLTCDAVHCSPERPVGKAELKLVRSLARDILLCNEKEQTGEWSFPECGKPHDHARFYRDPKHCEALDFLRSQNAQQGMIGLPAAADIHSKIIINVSAFPAVALSTHLEWPKLMWGKCSVRGKNPWPHPLA